MKKLASIVLAVSVTVIFLAGTIFYVQAQEYKTPRMKLDPKQVQAPIAKPKADLRVDVIHSTSCACDLPGIDAFYMGNILVDVSNGSGAATAGTLTVTYHDLSVGHMVTVTKPISTLNPYPTNPWCLQMFKVVDTPVLVKKSVGIKAEIKPSPPVTDSNPANNVKIEKRCAPMVY